ncbi:MAG: Coenzyme F420 hydrogenase/dehydrogenase, beta subunit C-terminal domain [Candidatus Woesearchaeota archaeon]
MKNFDAKTLKKLVIDNGYCIGCGNCATLKNSDFRMSLNDFGQFVPILNDKKKISKIDYSRICPFSGECHNEDEIGINLFSRNCEHENNVGFYLACYAGFVKQKGYRENGSSGGIGTWLLTELMRKRLIDYVINVRKTDNRNSSYPVIFEYSISNSIRDILCGAKSRYYPIQLSSVLKIVRAKKGRYAIIGIPCFIKAVRLLSENDNLIKKRIKYCIGLICGHLKSSRFADMIAWQMGIRPGNLTDINFRKKYPGRNADDYGIEITGFIDGHIVTKSSPNKELFGMDWGLGFFKYEACDYCDDVFAETADLSIGDAWLPEYVNDYKGTNIIVARNPELQNILLSAVKEKRIYIKNIPVETAVKSQLAGLKHRRDGLAYRIWLKQKKGLWFPRKRVRPNYDHLSLVYRCIFSLRTKISKRSHLAFQKANYRSNIKYFVKNIKPLLIQYKLLYLIQKIKQKARLK